MISQSGYFGFRRKHWIQLSGSKNSQHGQTIDLSEIWSPTWEGQTLSSLVNGWETFIWLMWPGWPCVNSTGDTSIDLNNSFFCSFDIVNLYTNIPLDKTSAICADTLYRSHLDALPFQNWSFWNWYTLLLSVSNSVSITIYIYIY